MNYFPGLSSVKVQANNQGNNVLVANVGNEVISLCLAHLIADDAQQLKFVSRKNGVDTDLTGSMACDAGGGFSTMFNEYGHFKTEAGGDLVLYLANASAPVGGWLNVQRTTG